MATIPGGAFLTDSHPGDVIHGTPWSDDIVLHLPHDTAYTGDGNDLVYSTGGNAEVHLGDGSDVVFAYGGHNYIEGGAGHDIITVDGTNNTVHAGSGDALIYGGTGHDMLLGGSGNDVIHAGSGQEFISGGDGNNVIFAGKGDDTIVGGTGDNTFVFGSGGGKNVIVDFHEGDSIHIAQNINGLHIASAADLLPHIADDNGNAVITLGHESITLLNIKVEDIHANPSSYFHIQ